MSNFTPVKEKGLERCLVAANLDPERLRIHISEIEPGTRAHPPHTHEGVEAFYILEGQGELEMGEERQTLQANEAIVIDPSILHGLVNTGTAKMRYMVIITKP